ncbi:hypothetical protein CDAR_272771 [Caerostris darwini]|uniref:Uncharacterized protein n=1 Tax=Caerostris darwini TaxID=1538125 RepID=A0AAV4V036_9ARAC|nr:hypothetical protein CDAR_272771 [Caerostris darwini]
MQTCKSKSQLRIILDILPGICIPPLRLIKTTVQREKKPNNGRYALDSIKHVLRKGIPDILLAEQSDEQTEKEPSCFFLHPLKSVSYDTHAHSRTLPRR